MVEDDKKKKLLKPLKTAAIHYPFILRCLVMFVVGGALSVSALLAGAESVALVVMAVSGALLVISFLDLAAFYRKTEYHLLDDRLKIKTGGIFSDSLNELVIANVTYVSYELPFFERLFLGSGAVRVESAGSGGCEINMIHIPDPRAVYDEILDILRKNGFRMQIDQAIQSHKVCTAGKIVDLLGASLLGLFIAANIVFSLFEDGPPSMITLLIVVAVISVVGLVSILLRLLDLNVRRYRLFRDGVDALEGYFTKRRTFIPVENISDSRYEQSLAGRLFGFWTVKVSCQGAGKEVTFSYLADGRRLIEGIDASVEECRSRTIEKRGQQRASAESTDEAPDSRPGARDDKTGFIFEGDRCFLGTFSQSLYRALATSSLMFVFIAVMLACVALGALAGLFDGGSLFIPVLLIAGALALLAALSGASAWITAVSTEYRVAEDSISEKFEFIVKKEKEFSCDKITSIVFARGPIDWLLDTATVRLTSIGSSEMLEVKHQSMSGELVKKILSKIGLSSEDATYTILPAWRLPLYVRSPLFWLGTTVVTSVSGGFISQLYSDKVAVLTVSVSWLVFVLTAAAYSRISTMARRLELCRGQLIGYKGVFFRERVHVPYVSVKGLTAAHLFMSGSGHLTIDIAGEIMIAKNRQGGDAANAGQGIVTSNSFNLYYVDNLATMVDRLDSLLAASGARKEDIAGIFSNETPDQPVKILSVQPKKAQLLFTSLPMVGVVCLIGLAPFIETAYFQHAVVAALCGFFAWSCLMFAQVRMIRYTIERNRVYIDWGLFFRARKSVCFRHLDFIRAEQNFINKIFGTGRVLIHTTGSSRAELVVDALVDYRAFESEIKKHY